MSPLTLDTLAPPVISSEALRSPAAGPTPKLPVFVQVEPAPLTVTEVPELGEPLMAPLTFDTLPPPVIAIDGFPAPPGGRAVDPKFRSPVFIQVEPVPLTVTLPVEAGEPAIVAPVFDTLPPLVIFSVPFEPL